MIHPLFLLLLLAPLARAEVNVSTELSSRFLVSGERARLLVVVDGEVPEHAPRIPNVPGLTILGENAGRARPVALPGRRIGYAFSYSVLSYDLGTHTIPEFTVDVGGRAYPTDPIQLEIFSADALNWTRVAVAGELVRCGTAFRAATKTPYLNQAVPVEIKVYLPYDLRIEDWGIPDFKRDGLTAWRFEPKRGERNKVVIKGVSYAGVAYPSTLSPTRTGKVTIGPARLRLVALQLQMDSFGYRPRESNIWLDIPALDLEARPLPPGAPDGFSNAVGTFELSASTPDNEVHEGDPVIVNLTISGTGNLDSLKAPAPVETDGWKLYEATSMPRGEERRNISGSVSFRQFMRPLNLKSRIPPFRFVYFDPEKAEYRALMSDPIPLTILPSTAAPSTGTAPPPAADTPVERMTDILGVIDTGPVSPKPGLPWGWLWQLVPAALFLGLLVRIAWRKLSPKFQRDPVKSRQRKEFQQLNRTAPDIRSFYRAVGAFVERWFGTQISNEPELARILAERDERCFRPEAEKEKLPPSERRRILRTLRRHLALVVFGAMFALAPKSVARDSVPQPEKPGSGNGANLAVSVGHDSPSVRIGGDAGAPCPAGRRGSLSAARAYEEGRYAEAARLWLEEAPFDQLDADRLYNIGNCWYRLASPGQAALYYRRALLRDPTHSEARQNLRFLERKFGSLAIKRPEYQVLLAKLPISFWRNLVWAGAWMLALGLLVFPATCPGSRIRLTAVVALVLSPVVGGLGGLGWRYYPDDAEFAPPAERAVVVADDAVAHTDAARTSPEVIDAPPGSLCRIIAQRGRWTYVAFATRTCGWLPSEQVEPLIPKSPPKPPNPTRPRATEGST